LAKRISEEEKKEIIIDFINKNSLEEIAKKYNFSKLTISRNLKKNLGEKKYYELLKLSKQENKLSKNANLLDQYPAISNDASEVLHEESYTENSFLEIAPLDYEIDNLPQKDLSSVSINEVDFPEIVYMFVDNKIELETKLLKEYAVWNFLPEEELNRKTIEIFFDLKVAKRSCSKNQKVIKVPNSEVFKIVAPILISRGISRIVSSDLLIAL
tara:strand:+ start:101 stop:739 length:639 start_codon:yes stop_codon:yes gene_type:complete